MGEFLSAESGSIEGVKEDGSGSGAIDRHLVFSLTFFCKILKFENGDLYGNKGVKGKLPAKILPEQTISLSLSRSLCYGWKSKLLETSRGMFFWCAWHLRGSFSAMLWLGTGGIHVAKQYRLDFFKFLGRVNWKGNGIWIRGNTKLQNRQIWFFSFFLKKKQKKD